MRGRFFQCVLKCAATACGLWLAISSVAFSQELEELRDGVRTSPPPQPRPAAPAKSDDDHDSCDDWDDDCDDDDAGLWLGLGYVTAMTVTAPFWGPPVLIGDHYTEPGFFSHFPHEYGPGYMLIGPGEAFGLKGHRQPWAWAVRGRAEYGTDFDGLEWFGGQLLVEGTHRWGLDADVRRVEEQLLPAGQDSLWLGDANVLFRFAQSEALQMRAGLGMNYLSDPVGSDFGFNFTYGGDWFPVQPLVVSGEFDMGTLGSSQLYHLRATIGANWSISEAYVGYDYTDIGHTQIAGLVAGVRLWY
jgi:hypothetical protein